MITGEDLDATYAQKADCVTRLAWQKWIFGGVMAIVIGIMGTFVVLVEVSAASSVDAVKAAQDTNNKAAKVAHGLQTHMAVDAVERRAILEKLEEIRMALDKQDKRDEKFEHSIQQILGKLLLLEADHHTASSE